MSGEEVGYPPCPVHRVPLVLRSSRFGPFLGCPMWPACDVTHGVHQGSLRPLGRPADRATRVARMRVHAAFDQLWRERRQMSRREAYQWLAAQLGIPLEECHIGLFDRPTCERALTILVAQDGGSP